MIKYHHHCMIRYHHHYDIIVNLILIIGIRILFVVVFSIAFLLLLIVILLIIIPMWSSGSGCKQSLGGEPLSGQVLSGNDQLRGCGSLLISSI